MACDSLTLLIVRHSLDELVPVYVVLQTQYQDDVQLRSYISRLDIKVEAHALSSSRQEASKDQSPSPSRDIIWSITIDPVKEYSFFTSKKESQSGDIWSYIIWKESAHLSE